MNAFVQWAVVATIVAVASGYAALKLMPGTWRRRVATVGARWAAGSGLSAATARRVEAKLASGGACGSCDSCKACVTPAAPAAPDALSSPTGARAIPIRRAR